ncbi:MAG: DUF1565 domain-containing protein [Phycisphaerales bacterium]|nr:MAG: DUF1565 domain-containing protein [Phycisphaerales bacterium]
MAGTTFLSRRLVLISAAVAALITSASAETIYVSSTDGSDTNPGTKGQPLKTIGKAAALVNRSAEPGPTTIEIAPGIYDLAECVEFSPRRPYTERNRLTVKASILPDDPSWKPALMPVILSVEDPRKQGQLDRPTETYSIKVKISHVTIQGLKFLGNPLPRNWHCCVERIGKDLDDLLVTQCMFLGDNDALNIYCATLATGDRFVLDHSIFRDCHACTVFWDGAEGIGGKRCAMRHCIVDGAHISGVWTCQTDKDFEFRHNIVSGSEYSWLRKRGDMQRYHLSDSVIVDNKHYSGYGVVSGPTGQTGSEVTYDETNVVKSGTILLEEDKRSRDYLHVVPGTLGSDLGAGLFKNTNGTTSRKAR